MQRGPPGVGNGLPDFTNFVRGFVEVLNYVMVEKDRVEVLAWVLCQIERRRVSIRRYYPLSSPVIISQSWWMSS